MRLGLFVGWLVWGLAGLVSAASLLAPKVLIVTMFEPERNAWLDNMPLSRNISFPGLSPLFPHVSCNHDGEVCLITTGEGEINAAASLSAVVYSLSFDLRKTYILMNGIAGISPDAGTLGSVGLARYAVQVGLQYGIDARQAPKNWTYSFWNYGTMKPGSYPRNFYGTEVFELNSSLRDRVFELVKNVKLKDTSAVKKYRSTYSQERAKAPPSVFKGDVTTSDLYFTGKI